MSSVLGMVPSTGWSITNDGLTAKGWIDVSDSVGAKVYKMLRNGSLLWSIGFRIVTGSKRRRDGTVVIDRVDELLELSVVPVPANSRTRTIGAKADQPIPTHAELLERQAALGLDDALVRLERGRRVVAPTLDQLAGREAAIGDLPFVERLLSRRAPDLDGALTNLHNAMREEMRQALGGTGKAHTKPRDDLRRRATEATAEFDLERATSFDRRA